MYYVKQLLDTIDKNRYFGIMEVFPVEDVLITENLPYTVARDEDDEHVFIIEGPKIEKCLVIQIWIPKRDFYSSRNS